MASPRVRLANATPVPVDFDQFSAALFDVKLGCEIWNQLSGKWFFVKCARLTGHAIVLEKQLA